MSWDTFISVASNVDPERHIEAALSALTAYAPLRGISTFYVTEPIGRTEQPAYYNGVVRLESKDAPAVLKEHVLRRIEQQLGRVRGADRYAPRTIDLDILLMGSLVQTTPTLTLPDPDLLTRPFLAAAVLDIAPQTMVPGLAVPLASRLPDGLRDALTPAVDFSRQMKERFAP